jgi:hypothetical protein
VDVWRLGGIVVELWTGWCCALVERRERRRKGKNRIGRTLRLRVDHVNVRSMVFIIRESGGLVWIRIHRGTAHVREIRDLNLKTISDV